ncbi:MAG: hypothetical protein HYX72_00385 [Acidobacteria bacterium]|nr:hypothetical protein [Acidobacteriota bacterium]
MTRKTKAGFSLLSAVVLLAVALAVLYPFIRNSSLIRGWLAGGNGGAPPVAVWINKRSGFYYCSDSSVYGKLMPGALMPQPNALQEGYRPAGETCH